MSVSVCVRVCLLAPDIKDLPGATELILYHPAPEIKFTDVCFSYTNKVPILRNISFTVKPGSKVAIVGASGAGSVGRTQFASLALQRKGE